MHGPLDDDELSTLTSILPRQQVNQICRRLRAKGILSRELGPGKIVRSEAGAPMRVTGDAID